MAKHVLTNAGIYFAGFDLTGAMNQCQVDLSADAVEQTVFGDAAHNYAPGLLTSVFAASGFWDVTTGGVFDANIGTADDVLIVTAGAPAIGNVAYILQALLASVTRGGAVGDAFGFDVNVASRKRFIRGQIEQLASVSTTGASDGVELGALSASQRLWAAAITTGLPTGAGKTLDLTVESAPTGAFSSPTTRVTLAQMTGRGQAIGSVDGAVTDEFWRFKHTLGGSTPVFPIVAAFGIVPL